MPHASLKVMVRSRPSNVLQRSSECTEVYYILEGRGKMELNDTVIDVEPGTVVLIEPRTAHRLVSAEGVRTVVFGVPAFRQEDEYYDTGPSILPAAATPATPA